MSQTQTTIPKIIHQLWIGKKPRPSKFMQTWQDKHPDYEYIMWNEAEIVNRGLKLHCQKRIDEIEEINGKADIIRWEILYKYGGLFLDADSICIEPFYKLMDKNRAFVGYENENVRPGLVATGTMAFAPAHPLCRGAINWILANNVSRQTTGQMAWQTVGPGLLTKMLETKLYPDVEILPSYFFLPVHCTGITYAGHAKVYEFQLWGSTKQCYDNMNAMDLPSQFLPPTEWVSVLVSSYNTKQAYVKECLESIRRQNGYFGIEIVWINDGSDMLSTTLLERTLKDFETTTRFIKVIYKKWDKNMGIGYSLNEGVLLCRNEIIIKVDSDDILLDDRIIKQLNFMKATPDCVICGTNAHYLKTITGPNGTRTGISGQTNHPFLLTWESYKNNLNPSHWFVNHPCVCYKKSAILAVGNYNKATHSLYEDFELELKLLKHFGKLYNIQENLLYYRIHDDQVTANGACAKPEINKLREEYIREMIKN